jgi:hypothetical protein
MWRDLRRRRVAVVILLIGWFPLGIAAQVVLGKGANPWLQGYAAVTLGAAIVLMLTRCPVCGERFHSKPIGSSGAYFRWAFSRSCLNCGAGPHDDDADKCRARAGVSAVPDGASSRKADGTDDNRS